MPHQLWSLSNLCGLGSFISHSEPVRKQNSSLTVWPTLQVTNQLQHVRHNLFMIVCVGIRCYLFLCTRYAEDFEFELWDPDEAVVDDQTVHADHGTYSSDGSDDMDDVPPDAGTALSPPPSPKSDGSEDSDSGSEASDSDSGPDPDADDYADPTMGHDPLNMFDPDDYRTICEFLRDMDWEHRQMAQ